MSERRDELLTVAETAARLRVSTATVYRAIEEGSLPAIKIGQRSIRIPADFVQRLLDQRPDNNGKIEL